MITTLQRVVATRKIGTVEFGLSLIQNRQNRSK